MLLVAGNETTRNAISHGMNAFFDNPDQWELFKRERPTTTTVDEVLRWATPVHAFQRTATADTQLNGVKIAKGDELKLRYGILLHAGDTKEGKVAEAFDVFKKRVD